VRENGKQRVETRILSTAEDVWEDIYLLFRMEEVKSFTI
jgi:hypothetical protein